MQRVATDFLIETLKSSLKDPGSAQVSEMEKFSYAQKLNDDQVVNTGYAVCGNINAKNSYGGYVGARHFYAQIILKNYSLSEGDTDFEVFDFVDDYRKSREKSFRTTMAKVCKNELIVSAPISI